MSSESLMYKVLFDYDAGKDDELTIRAGDIIENVVVKGGGWASGHCRSRDRVGMFPLNHVRYVSTSRDNLCDDAPDIGPLSLDSPPPETYRVIYNFTPTIEEELQLSVGSIIELLEKNPSGWWRGRLDGREGLFPSNFVVGPISQPRKEFLRSQEVSQSPVVLRRSTSSGQSNIKSFHASIDQNIGAPLNSKLFDPEDEEPMRPEFGSISSQLDWSTASLSSFKKPGFFGKIKQTFTSTRSLFPKLLSAKNSSTSLNDRLSISSMSFRKRRNSFASFFNKSSTKLPQHSPGAVSQINHSAMFPGYKINSPLLEETTPRKKSLGDLVDRSPRDPEQSMSWIFEEPPESPAEAGGRSRFQSGQTDSGVKDMDFESPEEIFGPITEITDEVFEGIFDNDTDDKKAAKSSLATLGKEQDRSKIRTSLSPLERRLSFSTFRRSSIRTNPNVLWKPNKKEEIESFNQRSMSKSVTAPTQHNYDVENPTPVDPELATSSQVMLYPCLPTHDDTSHVKKEDPREGDSTHRSSTIDLEADDERTRIRVVRVESFSTVLFEFVASILTFWIFISIIIVIVREVIVDTIHHNQASVMDPTAPGLRVLADVERQTSDERLVVIMTPVENTVQSSSAPCNSGLGGSQNDEEECCYDTCTCCSGVLGSLAILAALLAFALGLYLIIIIVRTHLDGVGDI